MAGETPAVSVLITAYNVAPFIAETVESVLNQTFQDFEIVLVNDGSPDTEELERQLAPYMARIHYIKQENGGPGAARNTAIRAARAPLVSLLDGDDAYLPEYLEYQMAFLREYPDLVLVYPDALIVGGVNSGRTSMEFTPSSGEPTYLALLLQTCTLTNTPLMRKEVVFQAGLWDPAMRHSEDFDLWVRIARCGKIAYHRKPLFRYRVREGSQTAAQEKMLLGQLRVYAKNEPFADLTEAEREAVRERMRKEQANLDLAIGWRLVVEGDRAGAIAHWKAALIHLYRPKLELALWALRWGGKPAMNFLANYYRGQLSGR